MGKRPTKSENRVKFLTEVGYKNAKQLRNKATLWERKLYKILKDLHYNFKFQHPIICRSRYLYILDFYLPDYQLAIEVDSKQYHGTKEAKKKDGTRNRRLKKEGIDTLRLMNNQISTFTKELIDNIIKAKLNMLKTVKN